MDFLTSNEELDAVDLVNDHALDAVLVEAIRQQSIVERHGKDDVIIGQDGLVMHEAGDVCIRCHAGPADAIATKGLDGMRPLGIYVHWHDDDGTFSLHAATKGLNSIRQFGI